MKIQIDYTKPMTLANYYGGLFVCIAQDMIEVGPVYFKVSGDYTEVYALDGLIDEIHPSQMIYPVRIEQEV